MSASAAAIGATMLMMQVVVGKLMNQQCNTGVVIDFGAGNAILEAVPVPAAGAAFL
jgi:hypothetical protein